MRRKSSRPAASASRIVQRLLSLTRTPASVASSYISGLLPVAEELGVDIDRVLRDAGICREELARPDSRLPLYRGLRLLELAIEDYGCPTLGARLGAGARVRAFHALGYAAMSAENLGGAVDRLLRFEKLVWDVGLCELHIDGAIAELQLRPAGRDWLPDAVAELGVSGWLNFTRNYLAIPGTPDCVLFRHEAMAPVGEYEQLFQCPVRFGQPLDGVRFPAEWLQAPVREADPDLLRIMDDRAQAMLAGYPQAANLANEVRAVLASQLGEGEPDLEGVARALQIPSRTLQQRLSRQGLKFQGILDELRRDLALMYLEAGQFSFTEVAFLLGFSEQSAFNRAFRRWTGRTPGAWLDLQGPAR